MTDRPNLNPHDLSVVELVEKAMDMGLTLEFEYDGEPRIVEAHAVGISTAGRPVIRGYQTAGGSATGVAPMWRLFSVGKIHEFPKILDIRTATPREGYNPGDKGMSFIFKEL